MNQPLALLLTLACEVPLVLLLGLAPVRAAGPASRVPRMAGLPALPAWRALLLASIAASCLSHPVAWHVAGVLAPDEYRRGVWLIEAGVVLFEALIYHVLLRPGFGRAMLWSALANAASFALGQLPLWS